MTGADRRLIAKAARALILGIVFTACNISMAASLSKQPNIVIVVVDDWGFTDVGAYGSEINTPTIDALANQGMKFSNFHTAATCSPTRAMLLTGVDNHLNGLGAMQDLMPDEQRGKPGYLGHLSDDAVTLATMLKDRGYHTYISGKWHLGDTPDTLPPRRGFERSFIQGNGSSDNWEQGPWIPNETGQWYQDGKPADLPKDYYSSKFIVDKTIEYVDGGANDGKPFFAYVAFQAVHIPVQAPREFSDKYRGIYDRGWTALRAARKDRAVALGLVPADVDMVTMPAERDWSALTADERANQARRMEVYAGMAEAMDAHLGRLIDHLKRIGQYDNTVFVFLSDNGGEALDPHQALLLKLWIRSKYSEETERLGDKGAYSFIGPEWASAVVSPLSTFKQWAGEGGLRTPMIISGVPGMKTGHLAQGFVHVTDIVPTILEVAGVDPHRGTYLNKKVQPLAGKSILPLLLGSSDRSREPAEPVGYELQGNSALFKGDYKIVKNLKPVGDGEWHLYDITKDPGEVHDLRDRLPDLFKAMLADYNEYVKTKNVLPIPEGYDYRQQGLHYAIFHVLVPNSLAQWPIGLGVVLAVVAGFILVRRRSSRQKANGRGGKESSG